VLLHVLDPPAGRRLTPVYLRDAVRLRPDLTTAFAAWDDGADAVAAGGGRRP
jgi:hypothetical protein